jgi:hypothetical protein
MEQQANEYLKEVMQEQARVEGELKQRAWAAAPAPAGAAPAARGRGRVAFKKGTAAQADEEEGPGEPVAAVDYRITGFWLWQTVVVPPNVYVVHTRRGRPEPLHVGLGTSFRYNPYSDAFLVIPAAVQTLIINAKCICAERQGVLVQAYVQWIVDDVRTAYRKLDFSDPHDPMRIVNVQLREQAEAAIKDKVATMGIDDVLSDKQPIIDELTNRLRAVAEGSREGYAGLGLKIVTVQIKEAVVSSTRLWESLQKPFRAEREKRARLAELDAQQEVARRELSNRQARETAELEHGRLLAQLRADQEREAYDRAQAEQARRHQVEQAAEQQAVAQRTATEKARKEAELELALQQLELEKRRVAQELDGLRHQVELDRARAERERLHSASALELEDLAHQAQSARAERDLELFQRRRTAENDLSEQHVRAQLIERLPEIAQALPQPQELHAVSIAPDGSGAANPLLGFLAGVLQLAEGALRRREKSSGNGTP